MADLLSTKNENISGEELVTKHFISNNVVLMKSSGNKFYENDLQSVLTKEDSAEEYSEKDFTERIKIEVAEFINHSFDNVVVLAGAGSSVVVEGGSISKEYGKTMLMIAEEIEEKIKEDKTLFTIQELASMSNYHEPVLDIQSGKFNSRFNLEDFLSNLLTYEQFINEVDIKEKFIKSKDIILDFIKENTSYDFDNSKMKHGAFLKVLSRYIKKPNKLTIVTTNYDTLFEEAAESLNFTVMDGFTFSHNPYFDSDMFEWNLVKDVPNVKTKELEYKKNIINLLKIHGSLTWEYSENGRSIKRRNKNTVEKPIMVFPSSNKYMQSYENPYFDLFTKFQEVLRRRNTLLITTGFSFADNHIAKMILQAIKNNTGLAVLVSDYNVEQSHSNWTELDELRKNQFRVAFLKATLNDNLIDYVSGGKKVL